MIVGKLEITKQNNKKIMEVIENKRQLSEFDDEVFESIVDRIIVGETKEDGIFDYHTIKFILKTGETLVGGTGTAKKSIYNRITNCQRRR